MRNAFPASLILIAGLLQGCSPVATKNTYEEARLSQQRASSEAYREDQKIEVVAVDRIYEQFKVFIHVNVTSFNRNALISGEVPDETTRAAIEKIVSGIEGVRRVHNELVISGNSALASRSNDSMITSNVKMRFARATLFDAERIKVVTENGTVFLMGAVTRADADTAAEIASTASRVKLVVKLFDYTD